jgi:hypothetical protein
MSSPVLPPIGPDLTQWGRQLSSYLSRQLPRLFTKTASDNPSEDGILLWDRENGWPTVSYDGEWRQVVMRGGHATLQRATDVTAAAPNTAYSLTFDAPTGNSRIDRDATNSERIVFEEAGEYLIDFTAQIASTSGSTVRFYFWPAVNGADLTGSTMVNTLHQNGATLVVSRSGIFELNAGDYLEVKWAVDSTNGFLDATAATAFSPAAPAATLAIARVHE